MLGTFLTICFAYHKGILCIILLTFLSCAKHLVWNLTNPHVNRCSEHVRRNSDSGSLFKYLEPQTFIVHCMNEDAQLLPFSIYFQSKGILTPTFFALPEKCISLLHKDDMISFCYLILHHSKSSETSHSFLPLLSFTFTCKCSTYIHWSSYEGIAKRRIECEKTFANKMPL